MNNLPKVITRQPSDTPGFEPGPPDAETDALTTRPPRLTKTYVNVAEALVHVEPATLVRKLFNFHIFISLVICYLFINRM